MPESISDSRFYMWRTLFAIAHADAVVTAEERNFMNKALEEQPFTAEQRAVLKDDIEQEHDIRGLFGKITDQKDRSLFFHYARPLVWADGDFGGDEQNIILALQKEHFQTADLDHLEDSEDFKLAEEDNAPVTPYAPRKKVGFFSRILRSLGGGV